MATYLNEGDASRADGLNTASANSGDPPLPVAGAADRELTRQVEQQTRFFDTTLNAISDFAYFLNLDGRFQYANQALLDLLGITLGEIVGKNFHDLNYPTGLATRLQAQVQKVVDTKEVVKDETAFIGFSGIPGFYEYIFSPVLAADGTVEAVVGSTRDLTERKKAETELQASRGQLLALFETAPLGVYLVDEDFRIIQVNPTAAPIFAGISPLIGRDFDYVIHALWPHEYSDQVVNIFRHTLLTGEPYFVSELIEERRDSGVVEYYEWQVNRIPLPDGCQGVVCYFRDISAAVFARQTIAASEERLRKALSIETVGVLFLDGAGKFTDANDAYTRMSGFSREEMVSGRLTWEDLTPPEWTERSRRAFAELETTGRATPYEKELVRKDGSRFWALFAASKINENEAVEYVLDITERKRVEEALRKSEQALRKANEELEARVVERTKALRRRTTELGRMSELRQELLRRMVTVQEDERRSISRDLHDDTGQQVTALLLGLKNLKNNLPPDTALPSREILSQVEAIAGEIAQKSHRLAFTLRPTALDDTGLVAALHNYSDEWSRWSSLPVDLETIGFEAGRLLPEVETTIYRIVQEALTNVLRHAAGSRGATRVSIVLQRGAREVITTVEDNGPGFDVATTMNPAMNKRRLGLFGMRERAMLIGGTLAIESTPGRGTSIFLRVPLAGK